MSDTDTIVALTASHDPYATRMKPWRSPDFHVAQRGQFVAPSTPHARAPSLTPTSFPPPPVSRPRSRPWPAVMPPTMAFMSVPIDLGFDSKNCYIPSLYALRMRWWYRWLVSTMVEQLEQEPFRGQFIAVRWLANLVNRLVTDRDFGRAF
jgi:hypothetical protein